MKTHSSPARCETAPTPTGIQPLASHLLHAEGRGLNSLCIPPAPAPTRPRSPRHGHTRSSWAPSSCRSLSAATSYFGRNLPEKSTGDAQVSQWNPTGASPLHRAPDPNGKWHPATPLKWIIISFPSSVIAAASGNQEKQSQDTRTLLEVGSSYSCLEQILNP